MLSIVIDTVEEGVFLVANERNDIVEMGAK